MGRSPLKTTYRYKADTAESTAVYVWSATNLLRRTRCLRNNGRGIRVRGPRFAALVWRVFCSAFPCYLAFAAQSILHLRVAFEGDGKLPSHKYQQVQLLILPNTARYLPLHILFLQDARHAAAFWLGIRCNFPCWRNIWYTGCCHREHGRRYVGVFPNGRGHPCR